MTPGGGTARGNRNRCYGPASSCTSRVRTAPSRVGGAGEPPAATAAAAGRVRALAPGSAAFSASPTANPVGLESGGEIVTLRELRRLEPVQAVSDGGAVAGALVGTVLAIAIIALLLGGLSALSG